MRELVKMLSTGKNKKGRPTGYFYTTDKNKRTKPEKMEFSKYDPLAYDPSTGKTGKHVPFKETKI